MENMTASAVRDSRGADGIEVGGGALEDSLMAGADGHLLRIADGADGGKVGGAATGSRERLPTRMRCAASRALTRLTRLAGIKEELVPVEVKQGKKPIVVSEDDHRRPETTMETLEKLPPSFKKDGL